MSENRLEMAEDELEATAKRLFFEPNPSLSNLEQTLSALCERGFTFQDLTYRRLIQRWEQKRVIAQE